MERGKHFEQNQKKLEHVTDSQWVNALKKCRNHVALKLRSRTLFGAHTEERLSMDPIDYYVSFAYDSLLDGQWEWKDGRTLGQQLVRIADNRIGKEVEKFKVEHDGKFSMAGENIDELFYSNETSLLETSVVQEAVFIKKIALIEEALQEDDDLKMFWECVKEGMKRDAIASFMEKKPKQIDKLREKLVNRIKNSPHFQFG